MKRTVILRVVWVLACVAAVGCGVNDNDQEVAAQEVRARCVAGASCVPANPCRTGTISCVNRTPVCVASGNRPTGTPCNDGNACTTDDKCSNGVCGGTAVSCAPADACHVAGTCNPATGACSTPLAPGAICTAGQACLDWYVDCDSDGFGVSNGTPVHSCSQPPRPPAGMCIGPTLVPDYVSNNQDCCDTDKLAFPGQTNFFPVLNGCGNFDYNCDGRDTAQYSPVSCTPVACTAAGSQPSSCFIASGCTGAGCAIVNGNCVTQATAAACGQPISVTIQTCQFQGPFACFPVPQSVTTQPCN